MMVSVTRIAPTPSGYLHIGNLWSFVLTYLIGRQNKGRIYLRIDDMDKDRFRAEYLTDIHRTLEWMGFVFDSPPEKSTDSNRRHMDLWNELLDKYGNSDLYGCACSRATIKQNLKKYPESKFYPGTCRAKGFYPQAKEMNARLKTREGRICSLPKFPRGEESYRFAKGEDFVVKQKNGSPSYQVCSLADDLAMGTTLIVRGRDLLASSAYQFTLAETLGKKQFLKINFFHHPLIVDDSGEKISKSNYDSPVETLVDKNGSPAGLYAAFARILGLGNHRVESIRDLSGLFDLSQVSDEPIRLRDLALEG